MNEMNLSDEVLLVDENSSDEVAAVTRRRRTYFSDPTSPNFSSNTTLPYSPQLLPPYVKEDVLNSVFELN
jgi:hypothetical protein